MKSSGNRFRFRLTCSLSLFVVTPYSFARSASSNTFCPRISRMRDSTRSAGTILFSSAKLFSWYKVLIPWDGKVCAAASVRFHEFFAQQEGHRCLRSPHAGDGLLAVLAFVVVDVHRADGVAGAFHNNLVALGAIGILGGVARHIADVHVVKTLGIGDGLGALERLDRRGRKVLQKIFGMEAREV